MKKIKDILKFCSECQTRLEAKDGALYCPHCKRHIFINPVPAVAAVVETENGKLLLIKRAIDPFKDWWDMPGGFAKTDESLEEAMKRELKEETGLEARADQFTYITSYAAEYDYEDVRYQLIVVMFKIIINADQKIVAADDANDHKFVLKDEVQIGEIAFEQQREFLKNYLKLS